MIGPRSETGLAPPWTCLSARRPELGLVASACLYARRYPWLAVLPSVPSAQQIARGAQVDRRPSDHGISALHELYRQPPGVAEHR